MNKLVAWVVVGVLVTGVAAIGEHPAAAVEKAVEVKVVAQTMCPAMGGKINKALYVDYEGKRVYVCCEGCVAAVTKDPVKYIEKLESEGVTVAKLQTTCPVMGGKIDKQQYVDHDGKRIYVCCPGCIGKIKADPETYIKKLEESGVTLDAVSEPMKAEIKEDGHKGHNEH